MTIDTNCKITVFGDSIGKGIYTEDGKTMLLSENAVNLFEKKYGVKIDNRSVYGQSLKKLMSRGYIDRYISETESFKRNVAVIELGGNDADFCWTEVGAEPNKQHAPKTDIEEFSYAYKRLIERLFAASVEIYTCTIVPISSRLYFKNVISKITSGDSVLEFFKGDFDTIHRHQEMFNNEILKNSYSAGAKVIDLRKRFLNSTDFEGLMCLDGVHPNAGGQKEIFSAVCEFLAS